MNTNPHDAAPISHQALQEQQTAAAKAVNDVMDQHGGEFETASGLAALMAALPGDTPVHVAETVHIDPDLPPKTPTVTATVARAVPLVEPDQVDVVEADGRIRRYGRLVPGVELGAVIVAEGGSIPAKTIPWPWYERAQDALGVGDVDATLHAHVRLLGELAELWTDTPARPDGIPETVPSWINHPDLRQQLTLEAERLRQSAARLDALRQQITDRENAELEYERQAPELHDDPSAPGQP